MKVFEHDQPVRFSHCDPAGIVYFPRFFDMAHSAMEDWFTHGLGHDLAELLTVRRIGTPTVHIECDFRKPYRMGETLRYEVHVARIGSASLDLVYSGKKAGVEHLVIRQTICFISLEDGRPIAIPDDLRSAINEYLAT